MIIDCFAHFVPRPVVNKLKKILGQPYPLVLQQASGRGYGHIYDLKERIRALDRLRIDTQVITLPVSLSTPSKEREVELCIAVNDALARVQEQSRGRILAAANLPVSNPRAALEEFKRATSQLGLRAVQLFSNLRGHPLDSRQLHPLFGEIERRRIAILLHPTDHRYYGWIDEFLIGHIIGWPFDTSVAMCRLVFGGVIEKHPGLKIITHHAGGMIPYFASRIKGFHDPKAFVQQTGKQPGRTQDVLRNFMKFYADTSVYGSVPTLMCAYSFFGAKHMVLATDYPFGPGKGELWASETLRSVGMMKIPEEERTLIRSGNARRILDIK